MTFKEISRTVNFLRKKAALTQKELADLSGIGKTVVFDIEKGKETVRLNSLLKIFLALNITVELKNPLLCNMENNDEEG